MIDVTEAVHRVVEAKASVLCLDTCALLDLMRDPTREKFDSWHVAAALDLLARIEASPPTLLLLLAEQVCVELEDHVDKIEDETNRVVERINDEVNRTIEIMAALDLIGVPTQLDLPALNFPAASRAVVERFISGGHIVRQESEFVNRAFSRVSRGLAPAARAKQSMKDCVIIETYLHVARELRASQFNKKIIFLTTNTADYADGTRRRLHGDLASEFTQAGMGLALNFQVAKYDFPRVKPSSATTPVASRPGCS